VLDSGLSLGDHLPGWEIVSVIPRAFRPAAWAVVGRRSDAYLALTISTEDSSFSVLHAVYRLSLVEALATMLHLARS